MPPAPDPLSDTELVTLANAAFARFTAILLAVSGGPDSLALLLMAARWRDQLGSKAPIIQAATFDHGWRTEAAKEAACVARVAGALDVAHRSLRPPRDTPLPRNHEAARQARYTALAQCAATLASDGPLAIATGHHLDDQAETFLMRLARGSGVDGLSAMSPTRPMLESGQKRPDLELIRPFLDIPKERLVATLQKAGMTWADDPGNRDSRFERTRIRVAVPALQKAGITADAISTSARRLQRARSALDQLTAELAAAAVNFHDGAYAGIARERFAAAPAELQLRLLQRIWPAFAGQGQRPDLSQLETLIDRLGTGDATTSTLAGAIIESHAGLEIRIFREPGRTGLPRLILQPGETALWDDRFRVTLAAAAAEPVTIAPLPPAAIRSPGSEAPLDAVPRPVHVPVAALKTLPAAWTRDDRLLGVLHPAFADVPDVSASFTFIALTPRS